MPASDMLDVIHFFFESDLSAASLEQLEARDRSRKLIYRDFYSYEYEYSVTDRSSTSGASSTIGQPLNFADVEEDEPIVPLDPVKRSTKPFIPATRGDARSSQPFGSFLDGPLTH